MGLEEGIFCLGCCAGLMLVLLAVGLAFGAAVVGFAASRFRRRSGRPPESSR